MLTAALAYADAGWYVLPVKRGTKDPGSVVGKRWNDKSSRDPKQLAAWFAGTDHGIALHCGRSGAVVFDVDDPDKLPKILVKHLRSAPYQSTRPDTPHRGHYLFAMPTGRTLGNSTGRLGGAWGEVRGLNGVIIAAPTVHPLGGEYRWQRTGSVPALPGEIAELLDDASPAVDAATDAVVKAFITEHHTSSRPELLQGLVSALRNRYDAGESRHQSTVSVTVGAMKETRVGLYTPRQAIDALWPLFFDAVTGPPASAKQGAARTRTQAHDEFAGIVAWAVGQALGADLDEIRARVNDTMPDDYAWARCTTEIADDFWSSREVLCHIHDYALARRVSPWAALGAAMVHALAHIPPHMVLPRLTGSYASLNLFVAPVGSSGSGKDAAEAAAYDAITYYHTFDEIPVVPLGSGEGIAATYRPNGTKPEEPNAVSAAIFTAPEIDTWAAIAARQGSTLTAELRKLWMGQTIGQGNAGKDTRRVVKAHSYRACGMFGVQPLRSGPLLAAGDGGLPQRMVFLPAVDPDAPDQPPEAPNPRKGKVPDWSGHPSMPNHGGLVVLDTPPCARREIDVHRLAVLRGDPTVDPLDGHALLTRLKVAAALMALDGRTTVTGDDWSLAGVVMAVSARTRQHCQQALAQQSRRANQGRALAAAEREEIISDRKLTRCRESIERALGKLDEGALIARHDLRRKVRVELRLYFDTAIGQLLDDGKAAEVSTDTGTAYTCTPRTRPPTSENDPCTPRTRVRPERESDQGKPGQPAAPPPDAPGTVSDPTGHSQQTSANGHRDPAGAPAAFRRPGCVCIGQPRPCHYCELAAGKQNQRGNA
jgi:hypothetical protein